MFYLGTVIVAQWLKPRLGSLASNIAVGRGCSSSDPAHADALGKAVGDSDPCPYMESLDGGLARLRLL